MIGFVQFSQIHIWITWYFQVHIIYVRVIRLARSLSMHSNLLLGFSSSMLVTGSQDLILILLFSILLYFVWMDSIISLVYISLGTKWSTSTGTYWTLGQLLVFLMTVSVTEEVVHCRYFWITCCINLETYQRSVKLKTLSWFLILQIWRMIDLIYRPEDEVLTELEKFKSHVLLCAYNSWGS